LIIDDHHVQPAVERTLVVLDVRFDRRGRAERPLQLFDGNVDERERRDRLRLAVLEDLEVLFFSDR
jgi:hypothetical protein